MDPLTPNTSAFLSYLSTNYDENTFSLPTDNNIKTNPTSLPPSAFFNLPQPGRDTPETTPVSSAEAPSVSPPELKAVYRNVDLSPDSEEDSDRAAMGKARRKSDVNHKRKAGRGQEKNEELEDDEDSASDFPEGHEDKKQHGNSKIQSGARRGPRKSSGAQPLDEAGLTTKEKAARRKEQNRAAQKAFRERREAKVKDLEDKVAELEAKSFGTTIENENLRGILKRLQEENMALKQSAFTFSMPSNGSPAVAPTPQKQVKPPTPTHSNSDEVLRSVNDVSHVPHRSSSTNSAMSGASPASVNSVANTSTTDSSTGLDWTKQLFDSSAFNAFALGAPYGANPSPSSSSAQQPSPTARKEEVDALWASFYPAGIDAVVAQTQQPGSVPLTQNNLSPGKFPFVTSPGKAFNTTSYRDPSANALPPKAASQPDWNDLTQSSVDDFLASLTGSTEPQDKDTTADDDFDAQIRAILGSTSPSAQFDLNNGNMSNPFSPTSYLEASPPAINSNSQSPSSAIYNTSATGSSSNSASNPCSSATSPESNVGASGDVLGEGVGTLGPAKTMGEHVYIVNAQGKVIKPSELWTMMGMPNKNPEQELVIDDLCDQMRAKATCKDGVAYLNVDDAEMLFQRRGVDPDHDVKLDQRFGQDRWR